MLELLQIIAGYCLADALAGLFHLMTDHGIGLPRIVRDFQNHHERPWTMTFDLQPALIGIPIAIMGFYYAPWFLISLGLSLSIAQLPHYYTHFPAPKWVQVLQKCKIFLSPKLHADHHTPPYGRDYCVLSGWNNFWINWIAAFVGPPKA